MLTSMMVVRVVLFLKRIARIMMSLTNRILLQNIKYPVIPDPGGAKKLLPTLFLYSSRSHRENR